MDQPRLSFVKSFKFKSKKIQNNLKFLKTFNKKSSSIYYYDNNCVDFFIKNCYYLNKKFYYPKKLNRVEFNFNRIETKLIFSKHFFKIFNF